MGVRIAVQERQRFYREGLVLVLAGEPDLEVVGAAADARGLTRLFEDEQPAVVVMELDAAEWDSCRLAAALRKRRRSLAIIGIARSCDRILATRATQAGVRAVVTRDGGLGVLLQAVRCPQGQSVVVNLTPASRALTSAGGAEPAAAAAATAGITPGGGTPGETPAVAASLTARQVEVLHLVGAGLTTREISQHLEISPKTVENHKQRIFERLGVRNQAHAVAVAMRAGLVSHIDPAVSRSVS